MKNFALFRHAICATLISIGLLFVTAVRAETVVQTEQVKATLSAEQQSVAPGQSLWVALTFSIKPGWHTYWRTPGDSGQAPRIDWVLPEGVTASELQFPPPERMAYEGDLMNFGYGGEVTMLTELKIAADAAPGTHTLQANTMWLVCAEVCIPEEGALTLPLIIDPKAARVSTPAGAAIEIARAQLPQPTPWPVSFARDGKTLTLAAGPNGALEKATEAAFFPFDEQIIVNSAPQNLALKDNTLSLSMTAGEAAPNKIEGVLVVEQGDERRGYTVSAPVTAAAASSGGLLPLVVAMSFAFLGGIILNVMPCVLPVLVMKALSFMQRGTEDAAVMRRDGLAYTAGVMVTFGALVGVLLALRAAGDAVGWGFQLQSPVFVAALAYVMLILGLNLSGVFNIGGAYGVGQELTSRGGVTGSFFTGLLAVVVATPCTAPFMGTAIGFAFTQSPLEAILIFEALALGLASPYLLLSFVPAAARMLPKPGVWMDRVKQILAFPLYGAAAWLMWVMAQQLNSTGLAAAFAAAVLIAFVAWLYGLSQQSDGKGRAWALGTAAVALIAAVALTTTLGGQPATAGTQQAGGPSEPYSTARLEALRAEGRPVFINFTAAWCITCKVNERVALSRPEVEAHFKDRNIAYLKGDWTNRNAEISAALEAVGRDGVPLYLYYAPKTASPEILPQVLTPAIVMNTVTGG